MKEIINIFRKYPRGMPVKLKNDYSWENNTVVGYEITYNRCLIKLSNGTSVDVDRIESLKVETPGESQKK